VFLVWFGLGWVWADIKRGEVGKGVYKAPCLPDACRVGKGKSGLKSTKAECSAYVYRKCQTLN